MDRSKMVGLTRVGFAARGLLYLVIAWLVIETGRSEDMGGALQYLASETSKWLIMAMALGFLAYGIWRLMDAAVDTEGHGDDNTAMAKRAGAAVSGIIYLFLAYQAWKLFDASGSSGGGSGGSPEQQAQTVLELPGGGLLLGIAAVVLLIAGVWQIVKAAKASFLEHLSPRVAHEDWVKWFGRLGYGARGVIFIVTAWFLLQAALSGSSSEAGGMQEALAWLSSPVNLIVAAGLALFGIFSLIEARYRQIDTPNAGRF